MISRFPPSFADSPLNYAFAVFSLTLVSAVSISIIAGYLMEPRRQRQIECLLQNAIPGEAERVKQWRPFEMWGLGRATPVAIFRLVVSLFLTTLTLGALPDVIWLLAWGEAGDRTMATLFLLDRWCDGFTILPFTAGVVVLWRSAQVMDQKLVSDALTVSILPKWSTIRDKLNMVLLVGLIASLAALYKAYPS